MVLVLIDVEFGAADGRLVAPFGTLVGKIAEMSQKCRRNDVKVVFGSKYAPCLRHFPTCDLSRSA